MSSSSSVPLCLEPVTHRLAHHWVIVAALTLSCLIPRTSPFEDNTCFTSPIPDGSRCTCNMTVANGLNNYEIDCVNADLSSIPRDLPDAPSLRLEGNHIHILEHVSYTALRNLHLDNNDIRFVKDLAFTNLSDLIQLHMQENKISGLSAKTFVGLTQLKTLYMHGNRLYELENGTFSGEVLPNLELLILSSCRILRIGSQTFRDALTLRMLDLSDNLLISPIQFLGHLKIDTLNLSFNHLEHLHNSPFQRLTYLEKLSLSHNQISNLTAQDFQGLSHLTSLTLHNNSIASVDVLAFKVSDVLIELDLSVNRLRTVDARCFAWNNLAKLRVHGNPWICNCHTQWLHTQQVVIEWNLNSDLRCASPGGVAGRLVFQTDDHVFDCPHGHNVTIGAAIGVFVAVVLAIVGSVLLYKLVVKRKMTSSAPLRSRSNGVSVATTSSYSRVQDSRELFDSCVESNVT